MNTCEYHWHDDLANEVSALKAENTKLLLQIEEMKKWGRCGCLSTSLCDDHNHDAFNDSIAEKPNNVATTEGRGCQLHGVEGCGDCADKPKCEHKTVPTFDGLGVRLKCQLCGEYISE